MKYLRSKLGFIVFAAWLASPAYGGSEVSPASGSVSEDSEFGVIEEVTFRKSNWEPWRISASGDVHYLDNIRSIDQFAPTLAGFLAEDDDFVFRSGLSIEYTPLITDNLFFDATLTQDFYRFDELDRLDFDYFSGDLGLIYVVQSLRDLQLFARYRYEHVETATFDGRIYSRNLAEIGAQQVYRFAPGQSVFGAVKGQFDLNTNPGVAGYDEYTAHLGYQWEYDPFKVTLMYRFAYLDFDEVDRSDRNHILMLRGEYEWRDWLTLAADASFGSNGSSLDAFDYDTFGVGVGVSLQFTF
jgi:hypothetical protein